MSVLSASYRRHWRLLVVGVILTVVLVLVGLALAADPDDRAVDGSDPGRGPSQPPAASSDPSQDQTQDQSADPTSDPTDPSSTPGSGASSSTAGPGGVRQAPYQEVTPEPAIPLTRTADFGTGLTLRVTDIEAVAGEARGRGEVAGPAVRFRMEAENASGKPISLDGMTITVTHGRDRTPASSLSAPGGSPFTGDLGAGKTARASYVFAVPAGSRDLVQVTASYTGAAPMVVLAGPAG